jgi:hypothetical protein
MYPARHLQFPGVPAKPGEGQGVEDAGALEALAEATAETPSVCDEVGVAVEVRPVRVGVGVRVGEGTEQNVAP